jgi:hypothetical protein
MLMEMGQTVNRTPHDKSDSSFSSENENETSLDRKRLVELISELRNLLEDYSPSWYTEEQHRKVELALHGGKKH